MQGIFIDGVHNNTAKQLSSSRVHAQFNAAY